MSSTPNDDATSAPEPLAQKSGKVLRMQKRPRPDKAKSVAPPPQKPTQTEAVTLASGEQRSVTIEASNDKEWNDLVALTKGATTLSLDQKDITHRTIAAIAALRVAHEDEWKSYCEQQGMKWRNEAKSPFQCVVKWHLDQKTKATGENHTSKASMIAGCLDEYWETHRPNGMKPADVAVWLDKMGGYTVVYRKRLDRSRDPKDAIAERYSWYLALPPVEQRDLPNWLAGVEDGEVLLSARINRGTGKIEYRSLLRPRGSQFWYARIDQLIAARPEYGKADEPVCTAAAGRPIEHREARQEKGLLGNSTEPAEPELGGENPSPAETDFQARLDRLEVPFDPGVGGGQRRPAPKSAMSWLAMSVRVRLQHLIVSSRLAVVTPPALGKGVVSGRLRTRKSMMRRRRRSEMRIPGLGECRP